MIERDSAGRVIPKTVGTRPAPPPAGTKPPYGGAAATDIDERGVDEGGGGGYGGASGGGSGGSGDRAPVATVDPRTHTVTGGGTFPVGGAPRATPVLAEGGRGSEYMRLNGGPEGGSAGSVAQQTAQSNVSGATPFMDTPGMQIASQRVSGQDIYNDPAISAALKDFNDRIAPGIQNQANMSGLGRSTAALNSMSQAQGQMLSPMYADAMMREQQRLGNMNTAAENELGRGERSAGRVADANQNMAQMLMQMSGQQYQQQQGTAQNLMQAGGTYRDIAQQGNEADLNDFLRRQALSEKAVYAPFGGAMGTTGSSTSSTGK